MKSSWNNMQGLGILQLATDSSQINSCYDKEL